MTFYIVSGIILGFTAGISPGPLLVLVISESIRYGYKAGVKTALAPLITDTPIIILSFFILNRLQEFKWAFSVLSLCGAFYILYLAYEGWNSKSVELDQKGGKSKGLLKGFYTNMLNPHPYIFWISVGTPLIIKAAKINFITAALFILMFYIFIIAAKMIIAVLIGRYKHTFDRYYVLIQRILSIVLIAFSLLFIYEGLKYFFI